MASKFLRRSDPHQYSAASKSIGHSNHRPHITIAKHGSTSAANVSTLSNIDNHSWSAAVSFNGNNNRQYPGGTSPNSDPISKFQWRRRFRWEQPKWTNGWLIGNGHSNAEWLFYSIGCVVGFQFVGQWLWNRKKFEHFRKSKRAAERWEVSQ